MANTRKIASFAPPKPRGIVRPGARKIPATAPAAPVLSESQNPADLQQRIAETAYQIWEQGGRQDGRAVQDWLEAERRVFGRR